MKHEIEVTITPEGKIVSEVRGVKGPSCTPLVEWLKELGHVTEDRKTPDYHKPNQIVSTTRRG